MQIESALKIPPNLAILAGKRKIFLWIIFLLFLLVIAGLAGLIFGSIQISIPEIFSLATGKLNDSVLESIVFDIRAPRICLALLAGGSLAICGASLQGLFRNPMADPGLIGVSSGAAMFVIMGIVLGANIPGLSYCLIKFPVFTLSFFAFIGALLMGTLVYRLSKFQGKIDVRNMLMSGIAVNAFVSAISGFMIYITNDQQLRTITFWTMGSLNGATWEIVIPLAILVAFGSIKLFSLGHQLDCIALGENEAASLGLEVEKLKNKTMAYSALLAGSIVAFTGLIGFVGLVTPHLVRMIIGPKFRPLMVTSFLFGGTLLTFADVFSRVIVPYSELPIGIITALLGAPYFIFLISMKKRKVA